MTAKQIDFLKRRTAEWQKARGLIDAQAAKRIGLSRGAYANWKNGDSILSGKALILLLNELGVTMDNKPQLPSSEYWKFLARKLRDLAEVFDSNRDGNEKVAEFRLLINGWSHFLDKPGDVFSDWEGK